MREDLVERIANDPEYVTLKSRRTRFGWTLTILMLVVYYGFILLVAFDKELLAHRIGEHVTTWGMPVGLAVIVFTILITAFYVRRANGEFDERTERIVREALK
ncbi:MAG: DUF485 domain-containing protein [Burkholderiales bacterium]|jgi:uncharacterized membrane protein (DUF485 family)|nr:MAG: DUF485 domain-containing protein [Burkholderiales bacterium]